MFSVSMLSLKTPMEFIGRFGFRSGKDFDKFAKTGYKTGKSGMPVVTENSIAFIEAELINSVDVGTHTLFIGNLIDADILSDDKPLTYEYYHDVIKGKSPKNAPTYIKEEDTKQMADLNMKKYECTVCGYVYDPEKGDPDSGIKPGTPFEQLPDKWVCPVCGADKSQFKVVE